MSSEATIDETVRNFFNEAKVDLLAAEKLKEDQATRKRALFNLQQACEKALKAYFLAGFVDVLISLSELTKREDMKLYGEAYTLLKKAKRFEKPRILQHGFKSFFRYMDSYSRAFVYGKMRRYYQFLFRRVRDDFQERRSKIVEKLMKDAGLDQEKADIIFGSILDIIDLTIEFYDKYEYRYKRIEFKSQTPPCLSVASKAYWKGTEIVDEKFEGFSKKGEDLLETAKVPLETLFNAFPEIRETIGTVTVAKALSYYKDFIKPVFALPLHLCLLKYEQSSRYPDAPQPPTEEMESIEEGIETVRSLMKSVGNLI